MTKEEGKKHRLTLSPLLLTKALKFFLRGPATISLYSPSPHMATVDFANRLTIETRDYNHEHGS